MIWVTISSRSYFSWLYRASPSLAAKNIINLILALTIWWCPCVELPFVFLEKGVYHDQCVLLNSVSLCPASFCTPRPNLPFTPFQAGFRKCRGTRDQIANTHWIMEKAREFQKNIYFCFIDYAKALTVWITINCGKFWKRWEYQNTWSASWEICMQVRKQQLELDMEQQAGSK